LGFDFDSVKDDFDFYDLDNNNLAGAPGVGLLNEAVDELDGKVSDPVIST
jgi:hypothetical protein